MRAAWKFALARDREPSWMAGGEMPFAVGRKAAVRWRVDGRNTAR